MDDFLVVTLARHAMATRFELALWGADPYFLRAAGEEALAEIERLEAQLSLYRPDSELSGINARAGQEAVPVEPRLFALLKEAAALSAATGGAFDPTIAPLLRCWGLAGGNPGGVGSGGRVPAPAELEEALARVGMPYVSLVEADRTVRFTRAGMLLDLGAIGKGYAIDAAIALLREAGVDAALLHGGTSTVYGLGAPPGEAGWRVAIRHPLQPERRLGFVCLRDAALSVSAGHGKSFTRQGRTYGHVLDPRSGRPVEGCLLAAVAGPAAAATDALSTALLVLGEPGLSLVAAWGPGYRGLVAWADRLAKDKEEKTNGKNEDGAVNIVILQDTAAG
ncbi:MAG: FAD:protein FMN transferase [Armatimonadetes bacterium]|nr:FAD:protein FMN transferase [Armatimonadota bacterium]